MLPDACGVRPADGLVTGGPPRRTQFGIRAQATNVGHESLRRVIDEIVRYPAASHSSPAMAETAGLSDRQFTRLFIEEVGMSPARYVDPARVEAARALLETGDDALDVVGGRCGFRSPETMRRAFLRVLGMTPGSYRRRCGRGAGAERTSRS